MIVVAGLLAVGWLVSGLLSVMRNVGRRLYWVSAFLSFDNPQRDPIQPMLDRIADCDHRPNATA